MRSPTRTLLCLAAFAAVVAQAETTYKDGVIYCKADVLRDIGDTILSVSLPASSGYSDYSGNPCAVWNIGEVPPGGVADTFFSDKGPGAFQVKNDGNRSAFLYVVTGGAECFSDTTRARQGYSYYDTINNEDFIESLRSIFGDDIQSCVAQPVDRFENGVPQRKYYRLAVSTDVTGKIPAWRPLNWAYCYEAPDPGDGSSYCFREFQPGDDFRSYSGTEKCYQYLSYLSSGETQLFDLKFFAPTENTWGPSIGFIVIVEASEFRLWPHEL